MLEENNWCSDAMKKCFNKELVLAKKDNKDFKMLNFTSVELFIVFILMVMLK